MTTPTYHRLIVGLRRFVRTLAIGVTALGSLLLAGWTLDLIGLRSLLPGAWPLVVIAILFSAALVWWNEVSLEWADRQRRLVERRLAAQYTAASVLAESPRPAEAIPKLLRAVCRSVGWEIGVMWRVDARDGELRCTDLWHDPALRESPSSPSSREGSRSFPVSDFPVVSGPRGSRRGFRMSLGTRTFRVQSR